MQAVFKPKKVSELIKIMKEADQGSVRVRALGNRHSITSQFCTDGFGIDLTELRPDDPNAPLVTVPGGAGKVVAETWTSISIHELSDRLLEHEKSIGFSEIGFRHPTVGGVLANGAHGSAMSESTLLASRVRGLTLVNYKGELLHYTYDAANDAVMYEKLEEGTSSAPQVLELPTGDHAVSAQDVWHALLSNLGMLGFVIKLELEVEDAFLLWVRVKRHMSDEGLNNIEELAASTNVLPVVPSQWVDVAPKRCDFFQILWYPSAKGLLQSKRRMGRLFTMCGLKIAITRVSDADKAALGNGQLGKHSYLMDETTWTHRQVVDYVDTLYGHIPPPESKDTRGHGKQTQQIGLRLDVNLLAAKTAAIQKVIGNKQSGPNVIDVDNAVLNPTFRGIFASFKHVAHNYLNYAWPFDERGPLFWKRCSYVEDVRFNGAIFSRTKGGSLNAGDLSILGPSHRLISSNLADEGESITQLDYEVAVPQVSWAGAIQELRTRIRNDPSDPKNPKEKRLARLCLPMTGVFIRFSKVDNNTLLTHAAVADDSGPYFKKDEQIMFLDFVVYAPIVHDQLNSAEYQREADYHESYRGVAEALIRHWGGRPHWGKNANWWVLNQPEWCGKSLFRIHRECSAQGLAAGGDPAQRTPTVCGGEYQLRLQRFQRVIRLLDPAGRFENDFAMDAGLARPERAAAFVGQTQQCP